MCGVAGVFGCQIDPDALSRLISVVSRRGPECTRTLESPLGMLIHAALQFVAVPRNSQPLSQADGSALAWNGEIYNWRALNEQYGFGAATDTQTLLKGLCARGKAFLAEIEGQFAFIAVLRGEQLVVGRDKWGICPLVFGRSPEGGLAIASTTEGLQVLGVRAIKTLPAGTYGIAHGAELALEAWFELPRIPVASQSAADPRAILDFAEERVRVRIPDVSRDLFTTMGGIDSQFVTAAVARTLRGDFGGAVTVVPWSEADPQPAGDLPYVRLTLEQLRAEGIDLTHHVAVLTPDYVAHNLDRLLKLLGPDLFHILCGLAEDLVASTVRAAGGRTIMTAGGPDEAGRSYDRWTFLHRGLDEELAWRRLAEQFSSSEGVRAGLVFGEHGLENRVPLADLIQLAAQIRPEHKQRVHEPGDGLHLASMRMESKIFWRMALAGVLPEACLAARKEPIHGSTGAMQTLLYVLRNDREYQHSRGQFALRAYYLGWNGIVFGDLCAPDPSNTIAECQLYTLYRWSLLEPESFQLGAPQRYGDFVAYMPRCTDEPLLRAHKPLCYDWLLGPDVPLRAVI